MNKIEYFEEIYRASDDPWQYQSRWYEVRKRQLCLASLVHSRYRNGIELGCANGVFSEALAERCQHLLCIDANPTAIQLTAQRNAKCTHVEVRQALIPQDLPWQDLPRQNLSQPDSSQPNRSQDGFDLIVINEILYYLTSHEIAQVTAWIKKQLKPQGTLLCCHWRYPIEHFDLTGVEVHQQLCAQLPFLHYLTLDDQDFILDIWQHGQESIAVTEGLV